MASFHWKQQANYLLHHARRGLHVLIICPTGQLVHVLNASLPDLEGLDSIRIDTMAGVLKYQRPGADQKVRWTPPTALRKFDIILVDEGSQYDDKDWSRFYTSVKEQPQLPYTAVVADFQQLQPVNSGGLCERHCNDAEFMQ